MRWTSALRSWIRSGTPWTRHHRRSKGAPRALRVSTLAAHTPLGFLPSDPHAPGQSRGHTSRSQPHAIHQAYPLSGRTSGGAMCRWRWPPTRRPPPSSRTPRRASFVTTRAFSPRAGDISSHLIAGTNYGCRDCTRQCDVTPTSPHTPFVANAPDWKPIVRLRLACTQ